MHPILHLPAGEYSVLPLIEKADNGNLPQGPWTDSALRRRVTQLTRPISTSAIDSDSDDETSHTNGEGEFLVPFFVKLPASSVPLPPASNPRSCPSSRATSFSARMTPLPTLRSSSPTFSHPGYVAQPSTDKQNSVPIGFLRPSVIEQLKKDNKDMVSTGCRPVWEFRPPLMIEPEPRTPISRRGSMREKSRRGSAINLMAMTPNAGTPGGSAIRIPAGDSAPLSEAISKLSKIHMEDNTPTYAVGFADWVNEGEDGDPIDARNEHLDRIIREWKQAGLFKDQLDGWRDEKYPIYGPAVPYVPPLKSSNSSYSANIFPGSNKVMDCERAACSIFGFQTFGIHLTAYVEEEGKPLRIWVPQRSAAKATWPGYYDNTVAGGITAGQTPLETTIRECEEEATFSEDFVLERIKSAGFISYTFKTKEGWIQPELQYCYDLRMKANDPPPRPNDGEVASFNLLTIDQIVTKMFNGEFKPNCSLVLLDFFVRHGYLTFESDVRFLEVVSRLHHGLTLPGPA